ncbi:FtsW/RodA/SpoVE family cell cycle protein [Bacillus sp. PS06]|uniref:FtsW/RodA/SpoVE family cell cycle protein n=1 Tax=Bacillus sp. PS06 TaxID=2764176 RepID=UPI001781A814|nr:FtsW/RodA/SpoVE family cell cycle protein [Bacillus sp. PS06]MBD8067823.1 rod shape-determining protein RodA [Bacillus sp. PS06]
MSDSSPNKSYFDYSLIFFTFLLMICSLIAIASAQKYSQYDENFVMKQLIWFGVGCVIVIFLMFFDFEQISKITPILYCIGVLLLIAILVAPESIAPIRNGAKSWFIVPGFGSLQPSEFMKIFLILMLSYVIDKHQKSRYSFDIKQDLFLLVKIGIISSVPIVLVLLQNDFGSSLVMVIIVIGITFISGINWRIIFILVSFALTLVAALVFIFLQNPNLLLQFFDDYQLNRIYSWLDPFGNAKGIGYQLAQSILAIGSGGIEGKGYYNSNVYIPEAHSDFIFSIVGEEFGFWGACIIVSLYFLMIYRMIVIAMYSNRNTFELCVSIGVFSLFSFHVFQNIGMVTGLLPITGIPLLLLSYGGSSVLASMIGIGLVLNISLKKRDYMFDHQ